MMTVSIHASRQRSEIQYPNISPQKPLRRFIRIAFLVAKIRPQT